MKAAANWWAGLSTWRPEWTPSFIVRTLALVGCLCAVALATSAAGRAELMVNDRFSTSFSVFNPCANGGVGEEVLFTGEFAFLNVVTDNENNFVYAARLLVSGEAVGLVSGDQYRYQVVSAPDPYKISSQNGQAQFTTAANSHLVNLGSGEDAFLHQTFHITYTANGEVSAEVGNVSSGCR